MNGLENNGGSTSSVSSPALRVNLAVTRNLKSTHHCDSELNVLSTSGRIRLGREPYEGGPMERVGFKWIAGPA